MNFYFDPLDKTCKSLIGAIARGSEVTFRVYREKSGEGDFSAQNCQLVFFPDGERAEFFPMKDFGAGWEISLRINRVGLYFYRFRIGERNFGCGKLRKGVFAQEERNWQITVYSEDYRTPEWTKGGVMYQIFPDRFYKSGDLPISENKILRRDWGGTPRYWPNEFGKVQNNDFFGGNLQGVREKLDYLQELGVTVLYFNPIFEAYSNHRYDTGDYMKIDPLLGTTEDFDELVSDAKKRGIRIVLDGVFNHTGDDSRYFNKYGRYDEVGAYQSKESPYADWYTFREFPNRYDSWWGIEILPALNESSPSYQNFMFGEKGVLKHWLRHGIAGYRLDVADELPDFFLKKLRRAVKEENAEAVIIGEVWEDASNKISYGERRNYLQGFELDSVMDYPLKDAIISYVQSGKTLQLRETIAMLLDNYPKDTLDCLMNILGTHDTPRILTVLGGKSCTTKEEMAKTQLNDEEKERAKRKLKMAAVLQYTLPGFPCVYYGDENAMEGYQDPFCRKCFDWEHIDSDLHAFYRRLGEIRSKILQNVFAKGRYREVFADSSCLVFERKSEYGAAYVYVNNSAGGYKIRTDGEYTELLSGKRFRNQLEFGRYSYGIIAKMQE